ncbi:MAG: RNA-binding cell elongation regulator Jag/EloR [bacterium]
MRVLEQEGKTVEEAVRAALEKLGVREEDATIEIIDKGSQGFLGIGVREAKVRVSTKSEGRRYGEDKIKLAYETLSTLLRYMGVSADVYAEEMDGYIVLQIVGNNTGLLIGRKGQTLDAIQYIVNLIVNRASDYRVKVIVDSGGYREKQRQSLSAWAASIGEQVKRTGKEYVSEPLDSLSRKAIHMAFQNDPEIETVSEGHGLLRKVIISKKS